MIEIRVIPKYADLLFDKSSDLILYGSAGAGKSYFAAQKTLVYGLQYPVSKILVTRKTFPALRITSLALIRELFEKYRIPYEENKAEGVITLPNRSLIYFKSLDDPKKIRSLNLDFAWIEQAEEITYSDYMEIKRRMRGNAGYLQVLMTVTPEGYDHWIYQYFWEGKRGKKVHFSYKDNKKLPEQYIEELEKLKDTDEELYRKYVLGEWGKLTNSIYNNWSIGEIEKIDEWIGGVDFGFNNPSVFLLIGVGDNQIYVKKEIYRRGLTNREFGELILNLLKESGISKDINIYCDSAEPDRIEELKRMGLNTYPAEKEVLVGIDFVKRQKIFIDPECVNTIKEIKGYKWETDKNGNVLDKPVKFNDHSMDALRYALYTHLGRRREVKIIWL